MVVARNDGQAGGSGGCVLTVMLDPSSPLPDDAVAGTLDDGPLAPLFFFAKAAAGAVHRYSPGITMDRMHAIIEAVAGMEDSEDEQEQTRRSQFVAEARKLRLQSRELVAAQAGALPFLSWIEEDQGGCMFLGRGKLMDVLAPLVAVEAAAHATLSDDGEAKATEKAAMHFFFAAQHAHLSHLQKKAGAAGCSFMHNVRAMTRPLRAYLERELEYLEHDLLSQSLSLMDPERGQQFAKQMVQRKAEMLLADQASRLCMQEGELEDLINRGECAHLSILKQRGVNDLWTQVRCACYCTCACRSYKCNLTVLCCAVDLC